MYENYGLLIGGRWQSASDQEIISVAAQVLPPSVVELVETTLFKLIDQGFGAGILGAMFLLFTAGNAYLSLIHI